MKKKSGKKYRTLKEEFDASRSYSIDEAVVLLKRLSYVKFDPSVDIAVNLGVNPRHAEQNIRGAVTLPHGKGKKIRIIVFAKGEKMSEANEAGVQEVGGEDLAKKISGGWLAFDCIVATPDMMGIVGKLGKTLGPRGLMPNPKLGTVTFDLKKTIVDLKLGRAEFKVDKAGIVHVSIGKLSFEESKIEENIRVVLETLQKLKPSSAKGMYMKKLTVSSTMGPGIKVDLVTMRING